MSRYFLLVTCVFVAIIQGCRKSKPPKKEKLSQQVQEAAHKKRLTTIKKYEERLSKNSTSGESTRILSKGRRQQPVESVTTMVSANNCQADLRRKTEEYMVYLVE